MKLYRKQLNGLHDLEREKIKLRYQLLHLDHFHAAKVEAGNGTPSNSGLLGTLADLAGSKGSTDIAMQIGGALFNRLGKKRRNRKLQAQQAVEIPKQKSTTRNIVEDVILSYLVGKAVRVSINLLQQSLKKKKAKRIVTR